MVNANTYTTRQISTPLKSVKSQSPCALVHVQIHLHQPRFQGTSMQVLKRLVPTFQNSSLIETDTPGSWLSTTNQFHFNEHDRQSWTLIVRQNPALGARSRLGSKFIDTQSISCRSHNKKFVLGCKALQVCSQSLIMQFRLRTHSRTEALLHELQS